MIGLNKIGLNQVQLNRLHLNAPFPAYGKMAGGGGSGDGFPQLPGDVTRWHFGGLTNEMMAAMDDPRIEDADHKGRFLSFKNFLWGGMSGVGGYKLNWSDSNTWGNYIVQGVHGTGEITNNTIHITSVKNHNALFETKTSLKSVEYKVLIKGLTDDIYLHYGVFKDGQELYTKIKKDGIYTLPSYDYDSRYNMKWKVISQTYPIDCDITIEQLPLYPGFILGDGVDDFAVTEKELNFEDTYTVYTAFIPFQNDPARNMILCGKNDTKDFSINYSGTHLNFKPSTGVNLAVRIDQFALLVCKRNKDITTIINLSTGESRSLKSVEFISNPGLYYLWRNVFATFHAKAAIAGQIIDNGHFTTDEEDENILNWHKKQYPWLFPNQAWTVTGKTNEDEDRATIANITGNGNDLVLSNFGFAEGSGYGDYPFKPSASLSEGQPYGTLHFKTDGLYSNLVKSNVNSIQIKFNLRDMPEGGILSVRALDINTALVIKGESYTTDGSYEFVYDDPSKPVNIVFYNGTSSTGQFNFYVDIIPEYEGYLVTDGVDDTGRAVNLTISKDFTLVGEWILFSKTSVNAGLSIHPQIHIFNRPEAIQITFRTAGKTLPVKSLKAICSDGRCYDENWSELKINVGEFTNNKGTLFVASNGTNYAQIAFKNLGIYDNHILSKDDCIKAYNYLQTLKAK